MSQKIYRPCILLFILIAVWACSDDNKNKDGWDMEYDPNQPIQITSFYPDSGGMATNVIIEGYNLGTDTEKVKVYYNEKRASVVSVRGNKLYAITPRRPGETCVISVVIDKDSLSFDKTFKYHSITHITTIAGNPQIDEVKDGSLISAGFRDPRFLTIDKEDNIFVCEDRPLRRINLNRGEVSTIQSNFVGGSPNMLSVDAEGKVVIVPMDAGHSFYEFNPEKLWEGRKFEMIQAEDSEPFRCEWKHSVASCQIDGFMYVRSNAGDLIKFDPKSKQAWLVAKDLNPWQDGFGTFSTTQPHLLFFSYLQGRHIGVFNTETNEYKPYTGYGHALGHQDGALDDAVFGRLHQLCFDHEGNLFVTDLDNHCIRMISPEGVVSTVIGIPGKSGYKDGSPDTALLNNPAGVAVASDGTIYIADRGNKCIRKLAIE